MIKSIANFIGRDHGKFYFIGCSLPAGRGGPRDDGGHGQGKRKDKKQLICPILHCKNSLAIFLSPAGMPLTKLFLAGKNLINPGQGEFGQ